MYLIQELMETDLYRVIRTQTLSDDQYVAASLLIAATTLLKHVHVQRSVLYLSVRRFPSFRPKGLLPAD